MWCACLCPGFCQYQIILLGDRGTWVRTTCWKLVDDYLLAIGWLILVIYSKLLAGAQTRNLLIESPMPYHRATSPPVNKLYIDHIFSNMAYKVNKDYLSQIHICWTLFQAVVKGYISLSYYLSRKILQSINATTPEIWISLHDFLQFSQHFPRYHEQFP